MTSQPPRLRARDKNRKATTSYTPLGDATTGESRFGFSFVPRFPEMVGPPYIIYDNLWAILTYIFFEQNAFFFLIYTYNCLSDDWCRFFGQCWHIYSSTMVRWLGDCDVPLSSRYWMQSRAIPGDGNPPKMLGVWAEAVGNMGMSMKIFRDLQPNREPLVGSVRASGNMARVPTEFQFKLAWIDWLVGGFNPSEKY